MELSIVKRLHEEDDYVRPGKRKVIDDIPMSLDILPDEMILQILIFYFEGRQFSTKDVCLTSRRIYNLAKKALTMIKGITFFDSGCSINRFLQENCQSLVSLDCCCYENLTIGALTPLIVNNPQLRFIDLSYCHGLDPEILRTIGSECHGLRSLKYSHQEKDGTEAEEPLYHLFELCTELRELWLDGMFISDETIDALADNCPHLEKINLINSELVTDESMVRLAENCPGLTSVQIYSSPVGDGTITALAEHCKGLRHLSLSSTDVTDIGVTYAYFHCKNLERIAFMENYHLTDFSLLYLDRRICRNLLSVSFEDCPRIPNWFEIIGDEFEIADPTEPLVN